MFELEHHNLFEYSDSFRGFTILTNEMDKAEVVTEVCGAIMDGSVNNVRDLKLVRHGYWIDHGDHVSTKHGTIPIYECSECGCPITIDGFDDYCPNCGTKMDLGEEINE